LNLGVQLRINGGALRDHGCPRFLGENPGENIVLVLRINTHKPQ
jgi:hypothetical protein